MSDLKDQVLRSVPLEEVVLRYCEKERTSGEGFYVHCPFHRDDTPSMHVTPGKGFHCHGCGEEGDVIEWVRLAENVSFQEALHLLADWYNLDTRANGGAQAQGPSRAELREALRLAVRWYRPALHETRPGKIARRYLRERRGLSASTIERFGLGFAPDRFDGIVEVAREHGIGEEALVESGLAKRNDSGGLYDRFRGRIMFPIRDERGALVGLAGRRAPEEARREDRPDGPKYINSPETPLYSKKEVLYGMAEARPAARDTGRIIVVEGYTDVLALHDVGVEAVVAACGSRLTRSQAQAVARHVPEAVLVFDGDDAGQTAAVEAFRTTAPVEATPQVVVLPEGSDPADVADTLEEKTDLFIEENKQGLVDFLAGREEPDGPADAPEKRVRVEREIASIIAEMETRAMRREYIRDAARRIDAPPEDLYESVQQHRGERVQPTEMKRYQNMDLHRSSAETTDDLNAHWRDLLTPEPDGQEIAREVAETVQAQIPTQKREVEQLVLGLSLINGRAGWELADEELAPADLEHRRIREAFRGGWTQLRRRDRNTPMRFQDLRHETKTLLRRALRPRDEVARDLGLDASALTTDPAAALRGAIAGWRLHDIDQEADAASEPDALSFNSIQKEIRRKEQLNEERKRLQNLIDGTEEASSTGTDLPAGDGSVSGSASPAEPRNKAAGS
jgi:DNA primase catalytic core